MHDLEARGDRVYMAASASLDGDYGRVHRGQLKRSGL